MAAPDLITLAYLQSVYDTTALAALQVAGLPTLITDASRAVRTHTNRYFSRRAAIDELYTVVGTRRRIVLKEYPVNGISRCCTDPTAVLTLGVADTSTNQRATATLATSGDVDAGLVVTGLTLTRWASGVATSLSVPFSLNITVAAVAAAVNALGSSWEALAVSGYGLWGSADLRAVQGAQPALGADSAAFSLHTTDLPFTLDEKTGIVALGSSGSAANADPYSSVRWGPFADPGADAIRQAGGYLGVRAIYDAGFDVVPVDVQFLTAMAVKSWVEQMTVDSTLLEEHGGVDGATFRPEIRLLPQAVRDGLEPWRNVRG